MAMEKLEPLIGEWSIGAKFPEGSGIPNSDETGTVSCEWMGERKFVVERWTSPDPGPDGIAILGPDPEGAGFLQHYFDDRGVARIYKMTLEGTSWKLWRDEADFSPIPFRQRWDGTISDDGNRIEGAWERTEEGGSWIHDFALTYTRV